MIIHDTPDQEVCITLRLKGYMPAASDATEAANALLKRIEAYLLQRDRRGHPSIWRRFLGQPTRPATCLIAQSGDVLDIEEETEIYETKVASIAGR